MQGRAKLGLLTSNTLDYFIYSISAAPTEFWKALGSASLPCTTNTEMMRNTKRQQYSKHLHRPMRTGEGKVWFWFLGFVSLSVINGIEVK